LLKNLVRPKINPLITYLRPKDIPQVLDALETIPCDKLYINYYPYPHPHRIARDYFLAHPEYTHLCIVTNDLIVTSNHFDKMMSNVKNHPMLSVICGVCNVDGDQEKTKWNICLDLPPIKEKNRSYHWVKMNDELRGIWLRVAFAGFPFMVCSRHIIEGLMQRPERPGYDGCDLFGVDGFATDLWFCTSLWERHIPIFCDTGIEMKHLRYEYELQVGIKEPNCELYKGEQILNVTDECERLIHVTKDKIFKGSKSVQRAFEVRI